MEIHDSGGKQMSSMENIFTQIYNTNHWGGSESRSGPGSTLEFTEKLRNELPKVFEKFSIKKVFDGPCGDFHWMRHVLSQTDIEYVGGDIVRPMIDELNEQFKSDKVSFVHMDLTKDSYPSADLMICRDCLYHFSFADTWALVNKFLKSGIPYLLTTTHFNTHAHFVNRDIATGGYRAINLCLPPYNFPSDPLYDVVENVDNSGNIRKLSLWSREQILRARNAMIEVRKGQSKIFISIISYRDPLLMSTVMSAYNNARYKNQLVFGIVDQAYPGEFFTPKALNYDGQIRYLRVDPEYARGACWARNSAQTMWNGEDYFMQIDSHTLFDADWDETLINAHLDLKEHHDKPVITAYPHSFVAQDDNINNLKKYKYNGLLTLVVDAPGTFKKDMYVSTHARVLGRKNPAHGFLLSANCLFADGSICEEVPYDPYLYFSGEEHSLALRLWTHGYNIFHVPTIPVYHHYGRSYRTTVWSDAFIETNRAQKWYNYDKNSKSRLGDVVTGKLSGVYGLGNVRSLEQYIEWSGIDYLNKTFSTKALTGDGIFDLDYREPIVLL